jgi:hypothetical protein
MIRATKVVLYSLTLLAGFTWSARAHLFQPNLGIFSEASSVGATPPGCKAEFNPATGAEHRKAVLLVRQSLDRGSAYADVAVHGNGLTALQFRGAENEHTYQIFTQTELPSRVRLVRKGSEFRMYSGKPNGELKSSDPVQYISLKGPVYVGLGVCSHVATTVETAVFSNVSIEGGK